MSMKPACPMLSRPVYPKCRFRPMAARAYAAVAGATSCPRAWMRMRLSSSMTILLSADPHGATEQALRPDQEHEDEDQEARGVPEAARHAGDEGGHLDDDADHDGAGQRAERRTHAAEGHGGEHEEQQDHAEGPREGPERDGEQHAGQAREAGRHDPHDADDAVGVDARGSGERR